MNFTQEDLSQTIELINKTNIQYMMYMDKFSSQWTEEEMNVAHKMSGSMLAIITELKSKSVNDNNADELFILTETYRLIYGELSKIILPLIKE